MTKSTPVPIDGRDVILRDQLLRLEEVHQAQWRYSAAMQALDGAQGLLELQVAQLSESFGPGLRRKFRFTI